MGQLLAEMAYSILVKWVGNGTGDLVLTTFGVGLAGWSLFRV